MRRLFALALAIALGPGCLCLETPNESAHMSGGEGGSGAGGRGHAGTTTASHAGPVGAGAGGQGTGGSTGPGVQPTACVGLHFDGDVVTIVDDGGNVRAPTLVAIDATSVSVAFARPTGDGDAASVRVATFTAWESWPPFDLDVVTLDENKEPISVSSQAFGPSEWPQAMATLYRASEGGLYASQRVAGAGIGAPDPVDAGDVALFVRAGANPGTLLGYARDLVDPTFGPVKVLGLAVDGADGVGFRVATAGCATTPIAADAMNVGDGVLLAAALGQPLSLVPHGRCVEVASTVGPASTIGVAHLTKGGATITQGAVFDAGGVVQRLALAARSDGAWLAVAADDAVTLGRVDAAGALAASPADVKATLVGAEGGSIGLASLSEDVVLALASTGEDAEIAFGLSSGDPPKWIAPLAAPGHPAGSPVALLGSPDGRALIAAWVGGAPGALRIHLARLACGS